MPRAARTSAGAGSRSLRRGGCDCGRVDLSFDHFDEVEIASRRVKTSTSWCTPIVAGVYGLMLSRDPSLTREEALQILYHTAKRPDAQGKINGVFLDCALPGNCLGGVDPSSGCTPYPTDPEDASYVSPAVDVPFDAVTSRSRVLGYGLLDAEAAVIACNPSSRTLAGAGAGLERNARQVVVPGAAGSRELAPGRDESRVAGV